MKLFTCNMAGEGGREKNIAMALKEIYSDEEPNDGGRQLLMLLPYEKIPLQWTRVHAIFQHNIIPTDLSPALYKTGTLDQNRDNVDKVLSPLP